MERRLKILEDNKLAEANARAAEGEGERDEAQGGQDDSDSIKKRSGSPSAQELTHTTVTGRQMEEKRSPPASPTAAAASKGKKKNAGGVKKSKAQQVRVFWEKGESYDLYSPSATVLSLVSHSSKCVTTAPSPYRYRAFESA